MSNQSNRSAKRYPKSTTRLDVPRPATSAFDIAIAILSLTGLFVLATLFCSYLVNSSTSTTAYIPAVLFASVAAFALFVIRTVLSSKYGIADVLIGYFFLFSFAFVGIYQSAAGIFPWSVAHDHQSVLISCVVFIVFLSAYVATRESEIRLTPRSSRVIDDSNSLKVISLLLAISMAAFVFAGPANVLNPRSALDLASDGRVLQITAIGRPLALVSIIFLAGYIKRQGLKLVIAPILSVAIAMVYVWYNPVSTPRLHFIALIFAMATTVYSLWSISSLAKSLFYAAIFVLNYLALGPLKSLSDGIDQVNVSFYDNISASIRHYAFRVDFDVFQTAANGAIYVSNYGMLYFRPIIGLVGFFIPRAIWPDKPTGTSLMVHQHLGYPYTNLSYPLPIEAYTAGGIFAVAAAGIMMGIFVNHLTLESRIVRSARHSSVAPLVYALIAGYMPIILRGPINSVFPLFGVAFIGVAVMAIMSRRART